MLLPELDIAAIAHALRALAGGALMTMVLMRSAKSLIRAAGEMLTPRALEKSSASFITSR
jgi:hypothetical protein